MSEKPIIFSTEMVRAILDGRKSQTRRVIPYEIPYWVDEFRIAPNIANYFVGCGVLGAKHYLRSKYQKGDHLWVKETYRELVLNNANISNKRVSYKADESEHSLFSGLWKPSIFMPKKYTRIWLEVTHDPYPERLRDITVDDCVSEGVPKYITYSNQGRIYFAEIWNKLNKKRGYPWESNPWVWVIEFRRTK